MPRERTGYIFQNKSKKWQVRITFTDFEGKRRNICRTAQSKSDAQLLLKKINRQLDDEGTQSIVTSNLRFKDLAAHYEATYVKPAEFIDNRKIIGLREWKNRKAMIKTFCLHFGNRKLQDITYGDLLSFRLLRLQSQTKQKKRRTIATVNRELSALRKMFNVALQENWISKNPFSCGESLIEIAHERKRERILTISEENKLLFACEQSKNPNLKVIVIALLDTGARCGEMLKCQWKDLDFSTRILTIRGENTKTLKTRQVALTSRLFDNLMALFDNSARNLESRIFGISDNFRTSFKNACKRANIKYGGIDGLCIHSLRHTAATRLIQGQMPIQLVGRVLGHQQPQTTYRYLSANEETLYQAASILESIQKPKIDSSDSELIN